MDHDIKNRTILLLLDGSRLLSMKMLHQTHHSIDELLSDDNTHTKVRELRDSGRISDEHFHLLFPPTDLSQWDATITSRFLKHCTDLEEPQRKIMDELNELRNKAMDMYKTQEMSYEECTSEWENIVRFLERGKTLLTDPIDGEFDEVINRIKQARVTPEDFDRVNSWHDLESKYEDTDIGYEGTTEGMSVVHDAAHHGKMSTLEYLRKEFHDRLQERDKDGNHALHFAAGGGHIECLGYIFESFPDLQMVRNENEMDALHCAARGGSLDCLTYLISQGMNMDTRTKEGDTLLHMAAYGGSLSMVQYIYESFPDLQSVRNEDEMDALHCSARGGSLACLTYLLCQGMKMDTRSLNGSTILHEAAFNGSLSMVQYIFRTFPALKNEGTQTGMNALFRAVGGGSLDCVKYLISQGLNTDTRCTNGTTLLHTASYEGSVPMVQYIWETLPELNKEIDEKGQDALFSAVVGGSLDCVKYLISHGLNIGTRSTNGNTLLHTAAFVGSLTIVQYLCERCSDLKNEVDRKGMDALVSAVHGGSLDCVKYLIDQGLNTYTRSTDGNTLLHFAAYEGSVPMVQYIWETYPELHKKRNEKGQDALFSAVGWGSLDGVKYLISHGLNTCTRSTDGHTLLHTAAYVGSIAMVKYICEVCPDLKNEVNTRGMDALFSAVRGGSLDCVKYLISQGMKIDSRSKFGDTILHQAAFDGHEGIVRYLCENYFQLLSYKQTHGQTAIFSSINGGHLDMLRYLFSQIDPKQTDKNGQTILHAAAWKGKTDIVRYLCTTYTFLIYMKDFKGETAIQLARRNGHFECLKIIQERL